VTDVMQPPRSRPDEQAVRAPTGWSICRACRALVYRRRLARNLHVCPECGHHHPLSAPRRLEQLFDPGSVIGLGLPVGSGDPLEFVDSKPYPQRLRDARKATGLDEAVVCVQATIEGHPLVAAVMDFRFLGGSLGAAVGELITNAGEHALAERLPLLIVSASGGARMQEGAIALMQLAKTSEVLGRLDRAGVLTISLVTDPTFGGVAASYATLCDVILAEPGARLGFAGPRVIEQTIRQSLPPGFQRAEFLLEHGLVDLIKERSALRPALARLLAAGRPVFPARVGTPPTDAGGVAPPLPAAGGVDPVLPAGWVVREPDGLPRRDAWEAVRTARRVDRPTTLDYIGRVADDFEELHGDRLGADCPAIVGGLARLGSVQVVVIGPQKGHTMVELAGRNFGMPSPAGYRKAARLMRLAAKLRLPVLTLVDTPGAHPGIEAEKQGQAVAIAENLRLMSGLPVPIVTVVTGEGGSGGALALAVADRVLICSNAVYSVITPEGCAAILWNDPAAAPRAAEALRLDARELLRLRIVDGVILEPDGGAHEDPAGAAERLGAAVGAALRDLLPMDPHDLLERRRERFRRFRMD
jgi:acetyl-CoA carboxylase carboxyl transferase subunit beta